MSDGLRRQLEGAAGHAAEMSSAALDGLLSDAAAAIWALQQQVEALATDTAEDFAAAARERGEE